MPWAAVLWREEEAKRDDGKDEEEEEVATEFSIQSIAARVWGGGEV